jgi:type IV pilus assembly protein PilF
LVKDNSYRARPQAFENLGLVYLKLDETDAAKKAFERAVDLNFRQVRSSLELAELAYEAGDYDTAYERFRTYNSLARPSAQSLCLGLKLSQVKGEADEVASYGMALKNLYPKQAERCRAKS